MQHSAVTLGINVNALPNAQRRLITETLRELDTTITAFCTAIRLARLEGEISLDQACIAREIVMFRIANALEQE